MTTLLVGPKYKNGQVSVSVKNVGARYGQETVQVYLRNLNDPDVL